MSVSLDSPLNLALIRFDCSTLVVRISVISIKFDYIFSLVVILYCHKNSLVGCFMFLQYAFTVFIYVPVAFKLGCISGRKL